VYGGVPPAALNVTALEHESIYEAEAINVIAVG